MARSANTTHQVWYDFCEHFQRWYFTMGNRYTYTKGVLGVTKRKYKDFDSSKMIGWTAIRRVEAYAKKHPEIKVVRMDDAVNAGSVMVLIPHKGFGITSIFIPQCTDKQGEFFLYPSHLEALQKAYIAVNKKVGKPLFV